MEDRIVDFNTSTAGTAEIGFFVVIAVLWGVFVSVFYMVAVS